MIMMGRVPQVLVASVEGAKDEAVAGLSVALQKSLAELVARSGAAMAMKARLQWICITAVLFSAAWWWSTSAAFEQGRAAGRSEELAPAQIAMDQATKALPANLQWAAAIVDRDAQARAIWAAKTPTAKAFTGLSAVQVGVLAAITEEAPIWETVRQQNTHHPPWPCLAYQKNNRSDNEWIWTDGKPASVCITGYGNK